MTFILETGAGTPNATAYAPPAFVTAYLTDRDRETENSWSTVGEPRQQEACIDGTSYLDLRWGLRIRGTKLRTQIPGRKATGTATFAGQPSDTDTFVVGQVTYRLVAALAQENDVLIGASVDETVTNLAAAINTGGSADGVHEDTRPNYEATATADTDADTILIAAQQEGTNGNEIVFTNALTNVTVTGSGTLANGIDEAPQPREFPRRSLYDDSGRIVVGVPLKVKQAMAEYAVRSLAARLLPDPTTDDRGASVQRKREKFGPFEEETEYAEGVPIREVRRYPEADRLMAEYVTAGGVVIR